MIIIGLTGGIATGKSTTALIFRDLGIPVHDADAIVHHLMGPSGAAVSVIARKFGENVIAEDGSIDRQLLGQRVFADPSLRQDLESILHPLVAEDRDRFIETHRAKGTRVIVLDVPLLFETGGDALCDVTILCAVDPAIQRERAMARSGMTADKLDAIIASQMSLAEKIERADHVVDTGSGVETSRNAILTILADLANWDDNDLMDHTQAKERQNDDA